MAAQENDYVWASDPFGRLSVRLDHASSNFDKLEASAKNGSPMQKTAATYEAAIVPLTPVLETIAHNKTVSFLGRIPFVGKRFEMPASGFETASELSNDFVHLVDLNRDHIQSLRTAILTNARLQRRRRREDLPATIEGRGAIVKPLNGYEDFGQKQNRKLASYIKFLGAIDERNLGHHSGKKRIMKL